MSRALESGRLEGLSTIARGLAHEINSPLAAALSDVQFALHQAGSRDDQNEALESALASLTRIRQIVDRMRHLGEQIESDVAAPIDGVIRAAVEPLVPIIEELRGGRVDLDLGPTLPVASAGRLAPVVSELVTNASRAIQPGGLIVVRLRQHGRRVTLSVSDDGRGMDAEARRHAFEPFFTDKREWSALGLGLPLCYSVVSALGGTIDLDSRPGTGTRVVITLPCAEAEALSATP